MKWFQHYTDSHENPKMKILIRSFGLEGYAICWILREMVGRSGVNYQLTSKKDWKLLVQEVTKKDQEWLEHFYDFLSKHNFICPKALKRGNLCIPKMKEYASNWAKRLQSNYGATPEQLSHIDKITLDKITLEYIKQKGWESKIKNSSSLLTEIYRRNGKAAKQLALALDGNAEEACKVIRVLSAWFKEKKLEWTLETVLRHLPKGLEPEGQWYSKYLKKE